MTRLRLVFTKAAELLRPLADRLANGEAVHETDFFDIAFPTFGACGECMAWPGESHTASNSIAGACPHAGSVFMGEWGESDLPIVRRCADILDDLSIEVANDEPERLSRLVRSEIRRLEDIARGLDDADGSRLPPETERPTPGLGPEERR